MFLSYFFCCAGLMASCLWAGAQGNREFTPTAEDQAALTALSNSFQQQYRDESNRLPSLNKKDYQQVYEDRWKSVKEVFDKQEIYTSKYAQEYLNAVVGEIVKDNPGLQNNTFHCYFSRSYIPNAAYIGEGIILFNMGLFSRLTNESQVAFVLCHEISHYLLQHQEKSIDKYVTAINSAEVQAQLRKIKGSEYRKLEQLQQLVKGLAFDSRRHSRDHESEADSMAVVLMRGTHFALSGAPTTLALLDSIDKDAFDVDGCLQQTFNAGDYPFRKKWLAREDGLLGGHGRLKRDELVDSLKTHPDCALRIKLIGPMVAGGKGHVFVIDSVTFRRLRALFQYEVIEYAFASAEYTQSLFLSLELLHSRPGDVYGIAQVGKVLNGLYEAQKAHTLSKVADLPSPDYPANYNALLQFVQNLYLEDLASINYYFLRAYHPQLDNYPLFKKAYEESAKSVQ
jgi:Zn-dependent protease with chaperone function